MASNRIKVGSIEIKASPSRLVETYDQNLKIKRYGADNLYPQMLLRLIQASPTASICAQTYEDFIAGEGIKGGDDVMVNETDSVNDLVRAMAKSCARLNGYPLHITYNALLEISHLRCLPMETIRRGEEDSLGYVGEFVYCPDWSAETTRNKKKIDPKKDNIRYNAYSDDKAVNTARIMQAGGITNYKGELLYVSNRNGYPLPLCDAVLTDCSTEEGLCNITYRNCRNNFLTAGVLVIPEGAVNPESQDTNGDALADELLNCQGDQNAGKILTYSVANMATEKPEFVDFKAANFDKEFSVSNEVVVQRIYSAFKQDLFYTIRIGKLGFSGQVMADAYALMNMKVRNERAQIERTLKRLSKRMPILQNLDLTIRPLVYNSTTGQIGLTNNTPTA